MIVEFFKGTIPLDYSVAFSAYVGVVTAVIVCCFVGLISCIIAYFIEKRFKKK